MTYEFNNEQPLYLQLLNEFRRKIATGEWQPGEKTDSVRNLALLYEVNPNTVQRALAELEREELAFAERTMGRFICDRPERIKQLRKDLILQEAHLVISKAQGLQIDLPSVKEILEREWTNVEGGKNS